MTNDDIFKLACNLTRVHAFNLTGDERHLKAIEPMAAHNEVPCRVSADLRAKQREEDQYVPTEFDETRSECVEAVVPYELAKPSQDILELLRQIEAVDGIGALNKERALEMLIEPLKAFRAGCISRWRDL